MDILTSLAIVAFAALIHASFQLSVSVLTLLSGHAIGAKKSRARVLSLTTSYTTGAGIMTLLILSLTSLVFGIGVAVWLFYYRRRTDGTELWIPRSFAKFLNQRSKKTNQSAEALSLGLTSVIAELVFIIPTVAITALVLIDLPGIWQLVGIGIYTVISLLGLIIVWSLVGSGKSLARIQKWRTENKRFLQFSSGSALIVLGFFVYVSKILTAVTGVQ